MFSRIRSLASSPALSFAVWGLAGSLLFGSPLSAGPNDPDQAWLASVHDQARVAFYNTVAEAILQHPRRDELSPAEIEKIRTIETPYPRLHDILIHMVYQKDQPTLSALLAHGSAESRTRFVDGYLALARRAARLFVDTFFSYGPDSKWVRNLLPKYRGLDTVDVVIMATGYFAKIDDPPAPKAARPLSPEFDKQWGLDAGNFRAAHALSKGRGVKVAIIDSGIDESHPVFAKTRFGKHFSFIGPVGMPWAPRATAVDWGGHGTVVASIVARYAPEAQITLYKQNDSDTQNNPPYPLIAANLMAAGIYRAVHDGNDVINISAGINVYFDALREACDYARENNVVVVAAAPYYLSRYLGGNVATPGQFPSTISVTGIERHPEGTYGYWEEASPEATTTVAAPNETFSAMPTNMEGHDRYTPGISCATPTVTALVAMAMAEYPRTGTEAPGEYFETMKRLLTENARPKDVGFQGFSPQCGYGLIDAYATVKAAIALQRARLSSPANLIATAPAAAPGPPPAAPVHDKWTAVFEEGRAVFCEDLKLKFGLHPSRFQLRPEDIATIDHAAEQLPDLYESLVNLTYPKESRALESLLAKGDVDSFRARFLELCSRSAEGFVASLFTESPSTRARLGLPGNRAQTRLRLVLASLGGLRAPIAAGRPRAGRPGEDVSLPDWPLQVARFPEALKVTRGEKTQIAVIASGLDHGLPVYGNGVRMMASLASLVAPEARIVLYGTGYAEAPPYPYWPASQVAQGIYRAVDEGADIIVTDAAFDLDLTTLREACQFAYEKNVIIVAPNGEGSKASEAAIYPSSYATTISVAAAVPAADGKAVPWDQSQPAVTTSIAAPAAVGVEASPSPSLAPRNAQAAALCAGLAALVSSRIPKDGSELPGQYFQRVREILLRTASTQALGFESFDPRVGHGLINAEAAVTVGVEAYRAKMSKIQADFDKRLKSIRQEAEKKEKAKAHSPRNP